MKYVLNEISKYTNKIVSRVFFKNLGFPNEGSVTDLYNVKIIQKELTSRYLGMNPYKISIKEDK